MDTKFELTGSNNPAKLTYCLFTPLDKGWCRYLFHPEKGKLIISYKYLHTNNYMYQQYSHLKFPTTYTYPNIT